MISVPGSKLGPALLRFDPEIPSRAGSHPFKALRTHGPYDSSRVDLGNGALLFVFPEQEQALARRLATALLSGVGAYPGFAKMFTVPVATGEAIKQRRVAADLSRPAAAAAAYRREIEAWNQEPRERDPSLALVLVPRTEPAEINTPYYEAKAAFANLGIPSQMVTLELLDNEREFRFSVANIALAAFAKLGGVPWAVDAPPDDHDLVVGVGRADVGAQRDLKRFFGYAVAFVSNGIYRQTWSFTPTADEDTYEQNLERAVSGALSQDLDQAPKRLVIHLARNAGRREIAAVERATNVVGLKLPVAFLRLDDSSLHDIADTGQPAFAPAKGLVAKLAPHRALLQTEGGWPGPHHRVDT